MRFVTMVLMGALLAGAALARSNRPTDFERALAGKQPGAPLRCVFPDFSAHPVILDGRAIAYFSGRTVYVNRFGKGGCPQMRQGRTMVTTGNSGRLCRDDPARVIEPSGPPGYGFCTFGDFVPYTKPK